MTSNQYSEACNAAFTQVKIYVQAFANTTSRVPQSGVGLLVCAIMVIMALSYRPRPSKVDAPVVGKLWSWEPSWLTGMRFLLCSRDILREAYRQVSTLHLGICCIQH